MSQKSMVYKRLCHNLDLARYFGENKKERKIYDLFETDKLLNAEEKMVKIVTYLPQSRQKKIMKKFEYIKKYFIIVEKNKNDKTEKNEKNKNDKKTNNQSKQTKSKTKKTKPKTKTAKPKTKTTKVKKKQ